MDFDVDTIIQGGAVGIAVLLIMYSAWKDRIYNKTLNNHLQHVDKSLNNVASAIDKQNSHYEHITRVLNQNTKIVGKAQDVMDKMLDKLLLR